MSEDEGHRLCTNKCCSLPDAIKNKTLFRNLLSIVININIANVLKMS